MRKLIFIILLKLVLTGCATTSTQLYDKESFEIIAPVGFKVKTELKTGVIKMGHSDWIDTIVYSQGSLPNYRCGQPGVHEVGSGYWMYDLENQKEFINNFNKVLISNSVYSETSDNIVQVHLKKIEQGPRDEPVYTFEVEISFIKNGSIVSNKTHTLKGNEMSKEFWTMDGWNGAKSRASNKLMDLIVADTNEWIGNNDI